MNSNYDNKEDTNYLSRSVLDDSPNYPILFSYCSVDTFYNIVLFFTVKTFQLCSQPNCQQNKSPEAF